MMNTEVKKTKQLFELIKEDLIVGWLFGKVAEKFGRAMLDGNLPFDSWLYRTVFVANLRELILALARLTDERGGNTSLPTFLRHADQNPQNFDVVTSPDARLISETEFRSKIADLQKKVSALQNEYPGIRIDRDKVLAHTDSKYRIENPYMGFSEDTLRSMKVCLDELFIIINALGALMNDTNLSMLNAELGIDGDFQKLLEDREPRNKTKQAWMQHLAERGHELGGNENGSE